jgi:hypothetical protein
MNEEERRKVREAWDRLKPWERFMIAAMIFVGILMSLTGFAMIMRGCQGML